MAFASSSAAPPWPNVPADDDQDQDDRNNPDDDDPDDDPIVASYPIYLNPSLPPPRRLLVLQQPNRISHPDIPDGPAPTELRLKPKNGMVELDVPLDCHSANFDRDKGLAWGRVMHSATDGRGSAGMSLGLAGGFGVGSAPPRTSAGAAGGGPGRRRRHVEGMDDEVTDDVLLDWPDALRLDRVLRSQTLGGQVPNSAEVQYMVGVFQGDNLHLTPVTSLIHLRPQLHHLDAAALQERNSAAAAAASAKSEAAGGAPAAGQGARAIHMTIKSTGESGEAIKTETMADRLRAVQLEPWHRQKYTDENDDAAWDVYTESLFLPGHGGPAAADESGAKGKARTPAAAAAANLEPDEVQRLERTWTDEKLLRTVSGMKNGRAGRPRNGGKPNLGGGAGESAGGEERIGEEAGEETGEAGEERPRPVGAGQWRVKVEDEDPAPLGRAGGTSAGAGRGRTLGPAAGRRP